MNIYSEKGSKVKFINKNGHDYEPQDAREAGLVEGEIYTVEHVSVGGWMSCVLLKEFPKKSFNTVMFEDVKLYTEAEYNSLKQENLQRLEEVKGLQHKVESLTEYSNKKVEHLRRAREDLSKSWVALKAEREARILMEATLERAMLDHQPVVLPMEVAGAIERLTNIGLSGYTMIALSDITMMLGRDYSSDIIADLTTIRAYEMETKDGRLLAVLANGYTVEKTTEDAAINEIANMLDEWADGDYVTDISVDEQNREFAKEIIDCVKAHSK